MMHLLQVHLSAHQYPYPYSVQMVSNPGVSFNVAPGSHVHNDAGSRDVHCLQSAPPAGHWSYSGAAATRAESPPTAPPCPPLSVNSRVTQGHSPDSVPSHPWTNQPLLSISQGFQGGIPGRTPHVRHDDCVSGPLSASPPTISQSQPTLCLQRSSDSDPCLLSSTPTGASTDTLLALSPTSYPRPTSCLLVTNPPSHSRIPPASAPPPALPSHTAVSPLVSDSPQSDAVEPHLRLGDPSSVEHTSLECLLGNRGSSESRDSESASSRRSSIGVQTQSTEQSWCLDLTD